MKSILIVLLTILNLQAVKLNWKHINHQYNNLSEIQKDTIVKAYKQGQLLSLGKETYGNTIATFVLLESSAGLYLVGDNGESSGLTHINIVRARELLRHDNLYRNLTKLTDDKIKTYLKEIPELSLRLTMINFKLNYERWGTYKEAVKAHNGYNPYQGFYNSRYYHKFVNLLQVVKMVVKERKI